MLRPAWLLASLLVLLPFAGTATAAPVCVENAVTPDCVVRVLVADPGACLRVAGERCAFVDLTGGANVCTWDSTTYPSYRCYAGASAYVGPFPVACAGTFVTGSICVNTPTANGYSYVCVNANGVVYCEGHAPSPYGTGRCLDGIQDACAYVLTQNAAVVCTRDVLISPLCAGVTDIDVSPPTAPSVCTRVVVQYGEPPVCVDVRPLTPRVCVTALGGTTCVP